MAKWAHSSVLDQGPNLIKTSATKMLLISAYVIGDSYATVVANKLVEVTMTSSDYTLASAVLNRTMTTATKTGTATAAAGGTPDLHYAFTNGTDTVYWVTDDTSNIPVSIGMTWNFPAIVWTSQQPI